MSGLLSNRSGTKGEQNGRGVIIIAGLILLVGGGFSIEIIWFLSYATAASGVVVDCRKEINPNKRGPDKTDLYLVVEFADSGGVKRRIESKSISEDDTAPGKPHTVYYRAGNVAAARLGGLYLWWVPSGCLAISSFLFMAGLFLVLISRLLAWLGLPMRPATGPKSL